MQYNSKKINNELIFSKKICNSLKNIHHKRKISIFYRKVIPASVILSDLVYKKVLSLGVFLKNIIYSDDSNDSNDSNEKISTKENRTKKIKFINLYHKKK